MLHVMVAAATAWIFIALAAVLACVATAAAARAQGRRLERRMVAELGRRWDQRMQGIPLIAPEDPSSTAEVAGPAPLRSEAQPARAADPDLRVTLEDLLTQRDLLLEEFQEVQAQISVLKKRVERRKPVAAVADDDDENVVRLHDVLPEEWAERRRR